MGIVISSGNALSSGAYSKQVVLPDEDAAAFGKLEAQLVQDFDPIGMTEAAMVHDLAVLTWKKLRLDRIEHAVLSQMYLLPLVQQRIEPAFGEGFLPAAMTRLVPYQAVTQAEYDLAVAVTEQAQAALDAEPAQRRPATVRRKWPDLYEWLQDQALEYDCTADELIGETHAQPGTPALDEVLMEALGSYEVVFWLWEHRERVAAAVLQAKDSRLMEYFKGNSNIPQRVFDDISRTFYRALSELRRQQDWRMRRTSITVDDVAPKPPAPADSPAQTAPA